MNLFENNKINNQENNYFINNNEINQELENINLISKLNYQGNSPLKPP